MKTKDVTEQTELDETINAEDMTEIADASGDAVSEVSADVVSETVSDGAEADKIIEEEESKILAEAEAIEETTLADAATSARPVTIGINKSTSKEEPTDIAPTTVSSPIKEAVGVSATPVSNMTIEATPMANQSPNTLSTANGNMDEWIVIPESAWPPPIFMNKAASPKERFYLQHRWHSQWAYYDDKAAQSKKVYYRLQTIVVIGSLAIPAIVSFAATIARFLDGTVGGFDEPTWRIVIDLVTIAISLAVAGAAAIESLKKYGENWNSYRSAAEELQAEKNYYDMGAGPYINNPNPFATFVDRVEGIVANQNGKYFQAVQQQLQKQEAENEEIIASFKSGDDDDEYALSVQRTVTAPEPEVEAEAETIVG